MNIRSLDWDTTVKKHEIVIFDEIYLKTLYIHTTYMPN